MHDHLLLDHRRVVGRATMFKWRILLISVVANSIICSCQTIDREQHIRNSTGRSGRNLLDLRDDASLGRHEREPLERNVFVRPTLSTPSTPRPSSFPTTPSVSHSTNPSRAPTLSAYPSSMPSMISQVTQSASPSESTLAPTVSIVPSERPSKIPSSGPSSQPSVDDFVENIPLRDLLAQTLTTDSLLTTKGTAQNRAYRTLSEVNMNLDPTNPIDRIEILERYSLVTFYFATEGGSWETSTSWATSSHPCGDDVAAPWFGLLCDETQTHVEEIELASNGMAGEITSEIRGLVRLSE